jgi:uncharacterized tellurite resistance protein B-like protein
MHKKDITTWNYEEFLAFLLLYAAQADLEMSEEEQELIIEKTSKTAFEQAKKELLHLNDYDTLQTILSFKDRFFATEVQKNNLINDLKTICQSDGKLSDIEQELMLMLAKIMK